MKKLLFLSAIIASALSLTSCSDKNEKNYMSVYTYTNVCESEDVEGGIYFETDYGTKVYVSDNTTNIDITKLEVGDRKITGMKLYDSEIEGYEYSATLFDIMSVSLGELAVIENDEQESEFADSQITLLNSNMSLERGFLNLYIGFMSDDSINAQYYLVENKVATPTTTKGGYVNLELRIDSDSSDDSKEYFDYVSFDIESLRSILEGKDGIILRINTADEDDEIKYIQIDAHNMYADKDDDESGDDEE